MKLRSQSLSAASPSIQDTRDLVRMIAENNTQRALGLISIAKQQRGDQLASVALAPSLTPAQNFSITPAPTTTEQSWGPSPSRKEWRELDSATYSVNSSIHPRSPPVRSQIGSPVSSSVGSFSNSSVLPIDRSINTPETQQSEITALKLLINDMKEVALSTSQKVDNLISRMSSTELSFINQKREWHSFQQNQQLQMNNWIHQQQQYQQQQQRQQQQQQQNIPPYQQQGFTFPPKSAPHRQQSLFNLETKNRYQNLKHYENRQTLHNKEPNNDRLFRQNTERQQQNTETNRRRQKRPNICCTENHLNNFKPIAPGRQKYSDALQSKGRALIITDSMAKGINRKELFQQLSPYTTFKCFPGATAQHLHHYMTPHLIEEAPTAVYIHGGTNDLGDYTKTPENIADELIRAGETAKQFGASDIHISSIIVRRVGLLSNLEQRRREVNRIIEERCAYVNFNYVDNDNISTSDLDHDRVHIRHNGPGYMKLASNIVRALNNRTP